MNVIKLQADLLKDALSNKGKEWLIEKTSREVYIGTKYTIHIIPHDEFLLDYEVLIKHEVREVKFLERTIQGYENAENLIETGIKMQVDKHLTRELKLEEENISIYVNEKLLKYFDKKLEFDGTGDKAPVYIYEGGELAGLVLPMKAV